MSCGGGKNGGLPNAPELDKNSPTIISITPGFEQIGVDPNNFIRITFDESLNKEITTEQVSIYPVAVDSTNENLITDKNLFKLYTNTIENDELVIELLPSTLKFNTRYRVTIQNINDIAGNPLLHSCQWDFITQNTNGLPNKMLDFNISHAGKCDLNEAPEQPQYLQAFSSNNYQSNSQNNQPFILLTWKAPNSGNTVEHYLIEKATLTNINSPAIFEVLNLSTTDLTFVDRAVTGGLFYIYRVTAHNINGSSPNNPSNTASLQFQPPLVKPKQVLDSKELLNTSNNFGRSITFNNDGSILAIGSYGSLDPTVQLFKKINDNWVHNITLNYYEDPRLTSGQFGYVVAFSTSGKNSILAIGQPRATVSNQTIGAVQIFINTLNGWRFSETLISNKPVINNRFGTELTFSPDGSTLAIGEPASDLNNLGTVQLFVKNSQNTWNYSETLQANTPSPDFGRDLAFSSNIDRTLLAVGGAERIQLFFKTLRDWQYSSEILGNYSGITFSPDGKTLVSSDSISIPGSVSLFNETTINAWEFKFKIFSKDLIESTGYYGDGTKFGETIKFNQNGTILAIADPIGLNKPFFTGTVQLFKKTAANNWNYITTLGSNIQFTNTFFGSSIAFSPDGATFAVGERKGAIDKNSRQLGVTNIFDLNNLVK